MSNISTAAGASKEPTAASLASKVALVVNTFEQIASRPPKQLSPEELKVKREEFLALSTTMSLEKQCAELKKHADTPMSYAEMRARFG